MVCSKCGADVADGFKFCPHCGTPVSQGGAGPDAAPAVASSDIPELALVAAGTFPMGLNEVNRKITLTEFEMGITPVTQRQYEYIMGNNPSKLVGKDTDINQFAGGSDIGEIAWYGENSNATTHDVGTKKPNGLGLYDMCGNVAEWCWDYMGDLPIRAMTNPHGSNIGDTHVKRGGSWLDDPQQCTVYFRSASGPAGKSSTLGFRVCRTVQAESSSKAASKEEVYV